MIKSLYLCLLITFTNSLKYNNLQKNTLISKKITFKTNNQELLYNSLYQDKYKIVICSGPAGTGKTLLSCHYLVNSFDDYNEIIYTKPLVSVDNEELGFLPGNLKNKMSVWGEQFIETLNSIHPKNEITKLIKNDFIKVKPMAYLRGKTFTNSLIIADEMQNSSPVQLKMLMTRIGDNSKLILLGDLQQKDIKQESGLYQFLDKYYEYYKVNVNETNNSLIKIIYTNETDILRSKTVKQVLDIYNFKTEKSNGMDKHPQDSFIFPTNYQKEI